MTLLMLFLLAVIAVGVWWPMVQAWRASSTSQTHTTPTVPSFPVAAHPILTQDGVTLQLRCADGSMREIHTHHHIAHPPMFQYGDGWFMHRGDGTYEEVTHA